MSWADKTQIANGLSVAGTELYSNAVSLNPGEVAHCQIKADFPASPTDDLEVRIYGTLDASSEAWDNQTPRVHVLTKDDDPAYRSIVVSGYYRFRLGFVRSGSTDTITVDAWVRKDGVNL